VKKRRLRLKSLAPHAGRLARFLFKSQVITIFLVLCGLGVWVGLQSRPSRDTLPFDELFDHMSVVSYRESPSDTSARFVVELAAAGKVFSQYDLDAQRFLPPARGRAYTRAITGTTYRPLRVRGHVAEGFWLQLPDSAARSFLPGQFDELYRTTIGFMKPVSLITNVLGILSGYSVGYRMATWGGSLSSRSVQDRVMATPDLGRALAREAWRRVLLDPLVMIDEDDAARFAAVHGTHRLFSAFLALALSDSDGFIPAEAERLAALGQTSAARALLDFSASARRAARDSVHLASADLEAVERWASLLDRYGHWAPGSIPRSGGERARYLGMLSWYGIAPPDPNARRVWIGPRMLVRVGDAEGFVTDDIMATRTGCPTTWRARLREGNSNAAAVASAWFADRPEFTALVAMAARMGPALTGAGQQIAANVRRRAAASRAATRPAAPALARGSGRTVAAAMSGNAVTAVADDSSERRPFSHSFHAMGTDARLVVVADDSLAAASQARVVQSVLDRVDALMGDSAAAREAARPKPEVAGSVPVDPEVASVIEAALQVRRESGLPFDPETELRMRSGIARGHAADAAADTLRARGVRDALVDLSGNASALGGPVHAERWRIVIRDPRERMPSIARLEVGSGQAVSTSSRHEALISVTVLARRAVIADAWSAALFALGPAAARELARARADVSAVLIEPGPDGIDTIWVESDLKDRFELEPEARAMVRVEYF